LAPQRRPAVPACPRMRAVLDEVVPADHLAADEAARDVRVDRLGGVERGPTAAERPRAGLLVAGREEDDQVERLLQAADDLVERGLAFAERGGLLWRELGELGLELEVDPSRSVLDREQRLRGQRLERRRNRATVVGERPAALEMSEQRLRLRDLLPEPSLARL